MAVYKDLNLNIDENEILRLLGYRDEAPNEDVLSSVRDLISESHSYLLPEIIYEKVAISKIQGDMLFLENNVVFQGEVLTKEFACCKQVIILISTLGPKLEEKIEAAFKNNEYLKGMILDNIGVAALSNLNKSFQNKIMNEISRTDLGITRSLSPGNAGWPLSEQSKIFQCVNTSEVSLTEEYMMLPVKSSTAVYGIGMGVSTNMSEHQCSDCSLKSCALRIQDKIELAVTQNNRKRIIKAEEGSSLLSVLRENDLFVNSPCGGKGICGKCKVKVIKGIEKPSDLERKHLSIKEIKNGIRLACALTLKNNMEISLLEAAEKMTVLTAGKEINIKIDPAAIKKHVTFDKPALEDQRDDFKKIAEASGIKDLSIDINLLSIISSTLRKADFNITLSIFNNNLLQIEAGDTLENSFGIAVDIGTTTIACYLLDLNNGKTIDVEAQVNKQRPYGADIISRINYTIENISGTQILKNIIINQLNSIVKILCNRNHIAAESIYNMTLVGNTTMLHLTLGLETKFMAEAPFTPVFTSSLDIKGKELGININGYVSILPGISSFVGSDITSGILSCGMMESKEYSLLLDLGTNGEIALGNSRHILTCSTAAGPAFEGTNIKCGTSGIPGAICTVDFSKEDILETIGENKPRGICGSGVMDIVSEFIKYGIIDKTGRMLDKENISDETLRKRIYSQSGIKEFILSENIVFTQKDIREVQMAKAAIAAGIQLLLEEMKIDSTKIKKVYIGGGFGNHMKVESAFNIGLLPRELKGKTYSVGNCAGNGAILYLLSRKFREKARQITEKTSYIELSTREDFKEYYINSMNFR